jgi:probable F420-dependent oxidoreductase
MKFGVNILNFGPGATPDAFLGWARVSESLGFDSIMISDHVAITPSVAQRYPEPYFDAFASLAWLAGQTSRLRLGTTVVVLPYRHPVLTARLVANIDRFSGGRFIFGVGVGNARDEFEALGQPHARRGRLADECLRVILSLWQEQSTTYRGRLVQVEAVSGIETQQKPHPPVWVGGNSEAALRRAVRFGQGWHPILRGLDTVKQSLSELARLAPEAGRPAPVFVPRIRLDLRDAPIEGERVPGSGSLEQVRSDLLALESLGAEHVTLDWYTGDLEATRHHEHGWSMLAAFAEKLVDLPAGRVR